MLDKFNFQRRIEESEFALNLLWDVEGSGRAMALLIPRPGQQR